MPEFKNPYDDHPRFIKLNGNPKVFENLKELGTGVHSCGLMRGYVHVTKKDDDCFDVMLLSGATSHSSLEKEGFAADFYSSGEVGSMMKTAFRFVWIWDRKERIRAYIHIKNHISMALERSKKTLCRKSHKKIIQQDSIKGE